MWCVEATVHAVVTRSSKQFQIGSCVPDTPRRSDPHNCTVIVFAEVRIVGKCGLGWAYVRMLEPLCYP